MNDKPKRAAAADNPFAVSGSMRTFGFLCHSLPRFWTQIARLETLLLEDRTAQIEVEKPIYVTSLARSGTTVLLEFLATSAATVTHRYKDFPPVFTPYFWNRFLELVPGSDAPPTERAHGDGMMITPDSPEAMEEILWMRFFPDSHNPLVSNRLDRNSRNPQFARFYRDHIKKLLLVRRGQRYLAKGNYNVARLAYIQELFPDARFVVPVRHPVTHIASLMRQHQRFSAGQKASPGVIAHLRRVGHFEFGLDRVPVNMGDTRAINDILQMWSAGDEVRGWALYWSHVFDSLRDQLDQDSRLRQAVLLIRYEDLCAQSEPVLAGILEHCCLQMEPGVLSQFAARLQQRDYYPTGLDSKDVQTILEVTSKTMARYGYDQNQ